MKKYLKSISALFIAAMSLTACMPEGTHEVPIPIDYNASDLVMGYYVAGTEAPTVTRVTAPQLSVTRSFTNETLTFQVRSLFTTFGNISFTTDALKYTTQNNKLVITSPLVMAGNIELDDFMFIGFYNWMTLQFTYQGTTYIINTKATVSQQIVAGLDNVDIVKYDGNTTVTGTPFDEDGFSSSDIDYGFAFQDGGIVNLYMIDAQFATMMPKLQLLIPGLQVKMLDTQYYIYSNGPIDPYSVTLEGQGDPYPDYVINDFEAYLPYNGSNGTISFKCSQGNWQVSASGLSIAPITSTIE